jgi:thioredoxin reductase (NADPH)
LGKRADWNKGDRVLDCLVIGGGPAGLTAAIYLARYRRSVAIFSEGKSRASYIPTSHNYPGFPSGISGDDLLEQLNRQAKTYGVTVVPQRISSLDREAGSFRASHARGSIDAKTVLLATGLIDNVPGMKDVDQAVADGLIRYCPVCDAFEAMDRKVAILGGKDAVTKAKFMRDYSKDVTVIWTGDEQPPTTCAFQKMDIKLVPRHADLVISGKKVCVITAGAERESFDILYPALGCKIESDLASSLGAAVTEMGSLKVDEHQRTTVEGLYAAGDVVSDLHQIAVATGHAAIAATHIHKVLAPNPR